MRWPLLLLIAVLVVASCGSPDRAANSPSPSPSDPIATAPASTADARESGAIRTYPTLAPVDENGVERACDSIGVEDPVIGTLAGELGGTPDSIWLAGRPGPLHVIWPAGFTARFSPAAELLDASGQVVAVEGDLIELQVASDTAEGTVERPYVADGILLGGCYWPSWTLAPASIATTVVDGVRVRSAPSVDDEISEKYSPLLPLGADLLVLEGPTVGSGYDWWQVFPMGVAALSGPGFGWVAAASRVGEPWLEAGEFACPPKPADVSALASLSDGTALACFPRDPITVRVRLVSCNCDADGPSTDPGWFGLGAAPILLVDPSESAPPARPEDWYELHLDPDAGVRAVPIDAVADVTGIFDHPASEGCTVTGFDEPPAPSLACRVAFAVIDLDVVEP